MKKPIIFLMVFLLQFCFFTNLSGNNYASASKKDSRFENNENLDITSKSGLLLECSTGIVVYEKNADEKLPIASMTKIATLALVFDAIDKGIIKENDMVVVSETAADVGGSSAFLDARSKYKLSDLLMSVIIASANDSSVALAEHVAGSEEGFVSKLNKMTEELGLKNTHFENCTGLPSKNHYSTARDIVAFYKKICNHNLYKKYSKVWMTDFIHPSGRKTGLVNTNRLIKTYDGIEGGKTGYTDSARFCLTASAKRGNIRFIGVIIGANDSKTRFAEMSKLFNYGFANYNCKQVVNKEVPVSVEKVKYSKQNLEVYPENDVNKFINKGESANFSTSYEINSLKAPIKKGDVVGKIYVLNENNLVVDEVNLLAGSDIHEMEFSERLKSIVTNW